MGNYVGSINAQYGRGDLLDRIKSALTAAGKNIGDISREDLAPIEEFHIGGREETRNLAAMGNFKDGDHVLDIGAGLGGPARTLAGEYGCIVTGIDLTEEYCATASELSRKVGMESKTKFLVGDALDLQFDDNSFEVVWMQHVGMNIEDKRRLYSGIYRVLKPGGRFLFHEIFLGNSKQLDFPVFWADSPQINHLVTDDDFKKILFDLNFKEGAWIDVSAKATAWFGSMLERIKKEGPPPLGLGVIVGKDTPTKAKNMFANLSDGRIRVTRACYLKG